MKCTLCGEEGHRCDNKKFHPMKKSINESKLEVENCVNILHEQTIEMIITDVIEYIVPTEKEITDEFNADFNLNFTKCVKGYHLINDDPIKETPWEDINAIILNASGCFIESQSNGSHKSGGDLSCSFGDLSNKSTKYDTGCKSFKISSYRLTTVCSDKNPGKIEDIINEINNRKNFKYYSIIVREERKGSFRYDWYLIPSDFHVFDPASYTWKPKTRKKGNNKDTITGWETNDLNGSRMSITFSMSSQLWIDINITDEIKQFIVSSCHVNRGRKFNYIQLYDMNI